MADMKDFIRYWVKTAIPKLIDKPTTTTSTKHYVKDFLGGFTDITGTIIEQEVSEELYYVSDPKEQENKPLYEIAAPDYDPVLSNRPIPRGICGRREEGKIL